jgi:hypothetical protein
MDYPTAKESVQLRKNSELIAESNKNISELIRNIKEDLMENMVKRDQRIESLFLANPETLRDLQECLVRISPSASKRRAKNQKTVNQLLLGVLLLISGN